MSKVLELFMQITKAISTIILVIASGQAISDGWSFLGKHDEIKGYSIVDVGEISVVNPPYGTKWNVDVFKLSLYCFSFSNYNHDLNEGAAALLLANAQNNIKLATFERYPIDIKVELYSIQIHECPSIESIIKGNIKENDDNVKKWERIIKELEEIKKLESQ